MRVVAGELKGRRLQAPPGRGTRPTSDRVREATFNALESLDAVDDAVVLDLFAGTGAMGIEALSRGARHVTFVERERSVLPVLRANLSSCRLGGDVATVIGGDGPALVARGDVGGPFDLAVLDPPYAFDGWARLLGALPSALAVCETGSDLPPPEGWEVARAKAYGGTVVTVLRHVRGDPQGE